MKSKNSKDIFLLYIGNKLMKHGQSATSIETLGPLLQNEGYTLFYSSDKKNELLRIIDMLLSVFKTRKVADYVLIDTYSKRSFYGTVAVVAMCRMLKKKYILMLRGGNLPNRLKVSPKTSRFVFRKAHKLIAPSRYLQNSFVNNDYETILIPNNIKIEDYKYFERINYSPSLLYVRAFHDVYNPWMAIDVLYNLKKIFPFARLCMVGSDKDGSKQSCEDYVRELHLKDSVVFTGYLSKTEWHKLAESYDIFINTTKVDNTPISVIEAMALGLPVVSTNVGGIPWLLENGKNAKLTTSNDTNEMVEAIVDLIMNPTKTKHMTIEARKYVETFGWTVVKEQWNKLLT